MCLTTRLPMMQKSKDSPAPPAMLHRALLVRVHRRGQCAYTTVRWRADLGGTSWSTALQYRPTIRPLLCPIPQRRKARMDKKKLSETDICDKFITPALQKAGWDVVE